MFFSLLMILKIVLKIVQCLKHGLTNYCLQAELVTLICLQNVYGCFLPTMAGKRAKTGIIQSAKPKLFISH